MNKSSLKYFHSLYEAIYFPIQVVDESGKVVYLNQAFNILWEYTLPELKEYSVFGDVELKRNNIIHSIRETFANKNYCFVENYSDALLKSKNITVPVFRTKLFHVSIKDENFVVFLHVDQTEIFLAEEEVKKARDGNKEAERLKNTFLNVLSHELRTPLNIILGYSSLIRESLKDKIEDDDKVYLDNLYSGSERLFKSITQMLEFAQLEAGTYTLNFETSNLISILNNSINNIRKDAEEKNLDIKTNLKYENVYVEVDVQCLENAVNNLLNNAVKFTRQGFIEVETNIIEERELVLCKIKDSGVGISTEYMDHLFRPFSQEDLNIGRNYEGNGLGLALSKRFIEKMGGVLLADSIKGVGSTFTFTLPLSQNVILKDKMKSSGTLGDSKKILMLDDSGDSHELINAFLKKDYDIEAYSFRDFKLEFLKKQDFSFLMFDVNPGRWDQGLIICRDIKRIDPYKRPIIVISSEFVEEKIKNFYEAGAFKFLVKPFSKYELVKALEEATVS
ncbi:MAG TPA: hybrid sensor histidine kinase/response regulator [Ignavibacteriaceae bacterium]|nr:hybrid sensor histidine kinase/response regulator [Ignavibacteriaceae bacterium]